MRSLFHSHTGEAVSIQCPRRSRDSAPRSKPGKLQRRGRAQERERWQEALLSRGEIRPEGKARQQSCCARRLKRARDAVWRIVTPCRGQLEAPLDLARVLRAREQRAPE